MLETNYYSDANLKWNYNGLETVAPNGVYLSNGDLDGIPKWVLQNGKGIRKDVMVVSRWMLAVDENYRKLVFKKLGIKDLEQQKSDFKNTSIYVENLTVHILKNCKRPTYMACGTSVKFFEQYGLENNLYLVGIAFLYSKKDFDNLAVTKKNLEEKYYIEYLLKNFQSHKEDDMIKSSMNVTYLPSLFKLKKHYEEINDVEKSNYYLKFINKIADESGRREEVLSWFK